MTLSEAKTQRRPHSARERVRRGGFLCCFVVFVSFFKQGKKRHRGDDYEVIVLTKGGEKGEARLWCKKGCGVTVGEPSGDLAGHVGGRCTPVHPVKEESKDDGPSQVAHRLT